MPAKHTLRYLPVAQDDLIAIFDFIAQDSASRALGFVEKLDKRISLLESNPRLDAFLGTPNSENTDTEF